MARLIKEAKPRTKKKQVAMNIRFHFEVEDDNDNDAMKTCLLFKSWMKVPFTEWDESILQHFLYQYNMFQPSDDDKYFLDVYIDKVILDDTLNYDKRLSVIIELQKANETE